MDHRQEAVQRATKGVGKQTEEIFCLGDVGLSDTQTSPTAASFVAWQKSTSWRVTCTPLPQTFEVIREEWTFLDLMVLLKHKSKHAVKVATGNKRFLWLLEPHPNSAALIIADQSKKTAA